MLRRWPVWLSCAFAVPAFGLFAVNMRAAVVPDFLVSMPLFALFALAAVALWLAWRDAVEPAGRRFWFAVALAPTIVFVGQVLDVRGWTSGPNPPPGPLQAATSVIPMVLVLSAFYRLPFVAKTRGERQRLLLDLLTVAVAVGLFVWYFAEPDAANAGVLGNTVIGGALVVVIALMVFGLLKALLSGTGAVAPRALRLFSASLGIEILGIVIAPLVAARPNYNVEVITRVISQMLVVAAACQATRTTPTPERNARTFSVLPYLAVASVDVLLLATLAGHHRHRLVVGITAVLVTGLVVARQIGAFRGNARLLDELGKQERRFRSLVQNATDVIAICDHTGTITYASPGVFQLIGRTPADLVGTTGPAVHPDDLPASEQAFSAVLAEPGRTERYEFRTQHTDGTWRRVRITMTNLLHDPAVGGIVTNSSDITETHEYHSQLSHQASHDSLTDLANRSLFGDQLARALAMRDGRPVSLALIDLDDFKSVNDTLGHHAGDALLIAVAERLRRGVRPQDLVARLGGDEFAVLLDGAGGANVEAIADRMLGILTEPLIIDGHDLCVQASVGIAEAGPDDSVDLLMRHADLALYEAKGAGKGRFVRYAEHMRAKLSRRAESAAELHRALAAGEFELHYQPIVTLPAGRLTGVEALLRWRHPERGLVSPADFIPVAEKTGMIVPIGRWVVAPSQSL
jgi:diguanylate cyclase (GGDEF)-like protein/PAS domain S-box-containing protein